MKSKVLSLMGFAKKSGNVVSGVNTCGFAIGKGRAKLVILAGDISAGSEKKIMKDIRSVFALLDEGFARGILKEIEC